jgi:hypothetical protein
MRRLRPRLPVWMERLRGLWRLRRLLPVLGTLRLVLDPTKQAACSSTVDGGPDAASGHLRRRPQSSSASRFTAGAFGFLTLTQCAERPEL